MLRFILIVALLFFKPISALSDDYIFEKIVLGKWGSGKGELGLTKENLMGWEGAESAVPPRDLAVDRLGNIYVVDQVNSRIQVFGSNGKSHATFYEGNKEWLSDISDIAIARSGKLYLFNYPKKQIGIIENNKLTMTRMNFYGFPIVKSLCNDKIIIDNTLFDANLNKISKLPFPYMDGKGNFYNISEEHGTMYGSSLLRVRDILDFTLFSLKLSLEGSNPSLSPSKRIWELLPQEVRETVQKAAQIDEPQWERQSIVIKALNDVIKQRDFYKERYFKDIPLPGEAKTLLNKGLKRLSDKEVQRFNRLLLETSYTIEMERAITYIIRPSRTPIFLKYRADGEELYAVSLTEFDRANIIGIDGNNNIYLVVQKSNSNEFILKYSENSKLLSEITLKPFKNIFKYVGKYKVSCNGDIYFYHHAGEAGSYKMWLQKGQYEVYRFALKVIINDD